MIRVIIGVVIGGMTAQSEDQNALLRCEEIPLRVRVRVRVRMGVTVRMRVRVK